jgi:hypothetical protein
MDRWVIGSGIALAVMAVVALIVLYPGRPASAVNDPTPTVPPFEYAGQPSPRFDYGATQPQTASAPLNLPPAPAPGDPAAAAAALVAMGATLPVPLAQPRTNDQIVQAVKALLDAKLPAGTQAQLVHVRPTQAGELRQQGLVVPHDDGTQVYVLAHCAAGCDVKGLVPSATQHTLQANWLVLVCERHYDHCQVIAGPEGSPRAAAVRAHPSVMPALPALAPHGPVAGAPSHGGPATAAGPAICAVG